MGTSQRNKYRALSDEELLASFRRKATLKITGELYIRYGHLVMGVAMKYMKNKYDAEDLTMNLFEQLPRKILAHDIKNFKSWLYMVTKNECLMFLRKKGNVTSELKTELVSNDELEEKEAKEIQMHILETEIDTLKEEQKICIKLFYIERKSYQEISEALTLDMNKVKSAIQNGKRNLKIKLEGRNEFKSFT